MCNCIERKAYPVEDLGLLWESGCSFWYHYKESPWAVCPAYTARPQGGRWGNPPEHPGGGPGGRSLKDRLGYLRNNRFTGRAQWVLIRGRYSATPLPTMGQIARWTRLVSWTKAAALGVGYSEIKTKLCRWSFKEVSPPHWLADRGLTTHFGASDTSTNHHVCPSPGQLSCGIFLALLVSWRQVAQMMMMMMMAMMMMMMAMMTMMMMMMMMMMMIKKAFYVV